MANIRIDTDSFSQAMATIAHTFRLQNPTIDTHTVLLEDGTKITMRFPKRKTTGSRK